MNSIAPWCVLFSIHNKHSTLLYLTPDICGDISVHKSKDTYIGKFISQTWTYQQERETDFSNDGSRIVAS